MAAFNVVGGRTLGVAHPRIVINPANRSEVVGHVHLASLDIVDSAVTAAARALPGWSANSEESRNQAVAEAITAIDQAGLPESFARLMTREQGKPLLESAYESTRHHHLLALSLDTARRAETLQAQLADKERRHQRRVPVGPVAIITPGCWPVALSLAKVIPALLAGNTVVLKPAPTMPLAVSIMLCAMASRLPPGVLNVVQGAGDIGNALVRHPYVRRVVFVGSTNNGRNVEAACTGNVKRITLDLGSNAPAVLLDDFEPTERNLARLLRSAFGTTGQTCWAIKRLYVPAHRHDEIYEALVVAANRIVIGNGLDPSVTTGPLYNRTHFNQGGILIDEARALGARLLECGTLAPGTNWNAGYFRRPMIAIGLPDSARLTSEEHFNPILPVLAYNALDQAVTRANAGDHGLCASVWGVDEGRAVKVACQLEAGQVFVNQHAGAAVHDNNCCDGGQRSVQGREQRLGSRHDYMDTSLLCSRLLFDF